MRNTNSDFCLNFRADETHSKIRGERQIKNLGEAYNLLNDSHYLFSFSV